MTGDDYEAIAALVQGVVAAAIPAIARAVREELQRQDRRALPEGVSDFDRELARIEGASVHEPGARRPNDYPAPMVDHAVERAEALARYRSVTAGSR